MFHIPDEESEEEADHGEEEWVEKARALRSEGATFGEIADKLDKAKSTVWRVAKNVPTPQGSTAGVTGAEREWLQSLEEETKVDKAEASRYKAAIEKMKNEQALERLVEEAKETRMSGDRITIQDLAVLEWLDQKSKQGKAEQGNGEIQQLRREIAELREERHRSELQARDQRIQALERMMVKLQQGQGQRMISSSGKTSIDLIDKTLDRIDNRIQAMEPVLMRNMATAQGHGRQGDRYSEAERSRKFKDAMGSMERAAGLAEAEDELLSAVYGDLQAEGPGHARPGDTGSAEQHGLRSPQIFAVDYDGTRVEVELEAGMDPAGLEEPGTPEWKKLMEAVKAKRTEMDSRMAVGG